MRFPDLSDSTFPIDLTAITVSEEDILADLLYPAEDLPYAAETVPFLTAELTAAELGRSARERLAA